MNIELLFKLFKKNYHKIKHKNIFLKYFRYEQEIFHRKRRKLKLGAIVFEIKETIFNGIVVLEDVDIRYIRQDNTDTDELKLENRLKAIAFKWDTKNVIALLVVIFGACVYFYNFIYNWYREHLPTLAFRAPHFDYLIRFTLESIFELHTLSALQNWTLINKWLVDFIFDFCIHFDVLF